MRRSAAAHCGLTLLEVVLALAILAGSATVLSQLVGLSMRAASNGRDLTQAQLLAESIMSEIAAGITRAETFTETRLPNDPDWLASAYVEPAQQPGMIRLTIVVRRDTLSLRAARYQLVRWLRDPNLALPVEPADTSSQASQSTSSSSRSSSGSSPSGPQNSGTTGGGR
jgi:prepilin-type N-terminal cleavage/methylation domain-containing protein